jgi:hypothetical protein
MINVWVWALFALAALTIASCAPVQRQPSDPAVAERITAICMASGFFKAVNGVLVVAYPPALIPAQIANYGIDQVCADPERFSSDVSTARWLIHNMPWKKVA